MATVGGKSPFPPRGVSTHSLNCGAITLSFAILLGFCNTQLLLLTAGSAAAVNTAALAAATAAESRTPPGPPSPTKNTVSIEGPFSPVHGEEPSSLSSAREQDPAQGSDGGFGPATWNAVSSAVAWLQSFFSPENAHIASTDTAEAAADDISSTTKTTRSNDVKPSTLGKIGAFFTGGHRNKTSLPTNLSSSATLRTEDPNSCSTAKCSRVATDMLKDMDWKADPCIDVNQYYCGNWLKHTVIPPEEGTWIISLDPLLKRSAEFLDTAVEALRCPAEFQLEQEPGTPDGGETEAATGSERSAAPRPVLRTAEIAATQDKWNSLLACSYRACMDEKAADREGGRPLFAAMFDKKGVDTASLSFLVKTNFQEELQLAQQADRAIAARVTTDEGNAVITSVDAIVAAAGGSLVEAAGQAPSDGAGGKREAVRQKSLLRILLPRLQSIYRRLSAQFFWSLFIGPHEFDASKGQTLTVGSVILGMPYHFYDQQHAHRQAAYKRLLARLLLIFDSHLTLHRKDLFDEGRLNNPNMKHSHEERARRIFNFEATVLKQLALSPEQMRDLESNTHVITFGELKKSTRFLDVEAIIKTYLQDLAEALPATSTSSPLSSTSSSAADSRGKNGVAVTQSGEVVIEDSAEFIIYNKDYFKKMEQILLNPQHWDVLHDYILVNIIRNEAWALSDDFKSAGELFLASASATQPVSRERRCVNALPKWLLGRFYAQRNFPHGNKALVMEMIRNLKTAFLSMISHATWMDTPTRTSAMEKLAAMKEKIGFPDWLLDPVQSQVYFEKYYGPSEAGLAAVKKGYYNLAHHRRRQTVLAGLRDYGAFLDSNEWSMPPYEVNAAYSPYANELAFMAAFLQEPVIFMPSTDAPPAELMVIKALNYGGVGAIIGHELSHGLDDEGRLYDAAGQMRDWWSAQSAAAFKRKVQCIRNQYNNYSVEIDLQASESDNQPSDQPVSPSRAVELQGAADASGRTSRNLPTHATKDQSSRKRVAAALAADAAVEARRRLVRTADQDGKLTKTKLYVDGSVTLGENLGDNVGLQMAWIAFKKEVNVDKLSSKPLAPWGVNLTLKQIFLYAWGHFWCEALRPAALREQMLTQYHTLSRFRMEGPLANLNIFAEEYECPANTPLNPQERCKVW